MSPIASLPIVVLNVHTRCNCRCAMCDIWKVAESGEMPVEFVRAQIPDLKALGVKWVVLSGGEPLMHSRLFSVCDALHAAGVRVTALTSGLLVERYARDIADHLDELIVSLDGPPEIHDRIRGIPGAFDRVRAGVEAVRRNRPGFPVAARCTVQARNHAMLRDTLAAAASLGLRSISYLAVDLSTRAFNRPNGPELKVIETLALNPAQIAELEVEVETLVASRPALLVDSDDHLRRIVDRFRAYAGLGRHVAPRCNAPWVSAVVEPDGAVRPCFFHPPVAHAAHGLMAAVNSRQASMFREGLDVGSDPVCRRCVCSLHIAEQG